MAKDLFGTMMGRALQRQAPQGHMTAFITQGEADVLRSLGGGVSPNGGQIMQNGIPSFQNMYSDMARDYGVSEQYIADPLMANIKNTIDESIRKQAARKEAAERAAADFENQANIDFSNLPVVHPTHTYQQTLNEGPFSGGIIPEYSKDSTKLNDLNGKPIPTFEDQSVYSQKATPIESDSYLQNLRNHPISQGLLHLFSPVAQAKALYGAFSNREPRTALQLQADKDVRNAKTPEEIDKAIYDYQRFYESRKPPIEDFDPALQQYAQRHGGRTPWELEQEAQQEEQEAAMLADAIANAPPVSGDPDDPDTELTEEEKYQERVASLSPEYAWRLGLTDSQPPPYSSGIQHMPTPEGFSEPATFISPGAYPDVFVNDMTGERFEAPSLGYVAPSGWRRV
jgi:hypothetical protein